MPQLVIGLGNPGGEYAHTRHNAGWAVLDVLEKRGKFAKDRKEGQARIREGSIEGFDFVLARPQTFMNLSGKAGYHLTEKFSILPADVIVIHDDIDLRLGWIRLKRGGGAGGQKGVKSLADSWRTQDFIRIRVGVGRPDDKDDVVDYVLDRFRPDERDAATAAMARAADAVGAIVRQGLDAAMNLYNRAPE